MLTLDLQTVPTYYQTYVKHVVDLPLMEALKSSQQSLQKLLLSIEEQKGDFRYAPEKWSIKELVCHMMDAERIFCYRALRFARNDKTSLHGFDENTYAPEANAHARTLAQLAQECSHLRICTLDLFNSFTDDMLLRTGKANNTEISVLALGYIIAGHETHHRNVMQERYLLK